MLKCPIEWPMGARYAMSIAWDVDVDTTLHLEHPGTGFQEYEVLASLRYEEVSIRFVVETLAALNLRQTFFVSAWCLERYPSACSLIVDGGHEVAHHGYMHEPVNTYSGEQEAAILDRGVEVIRSFCGRAPRGWRAPYGAFSGKSPELLVSRKFRYDSSLSNHHDPYVIESIGGELIELPIHIGMSDAPHYAHVPTMNYAMQPKSPAQTVEYYAAEVEAAREAGGFLTTVWHPEISGRPARLMAWAELVASLQRRGDVWMAPLEDVAEWVVQWARSNPEKIDRIKLPYYSGPLEVASGSQESPGVVN